MAEKDKETSDNLNLGYGYNPFRLHAGINEDTRQQLPSYLRPNDYSREYVPQQVYVGMTTPSSISHFKSTFSGSFTSTSSGSNYTSVTSPQVSMTTASDYTLSNHTVDRLCMSSGSSVSSTSDLPKVYSSMTPCVSTVTSNSSGDFSLSSSSKTSKYPSPSILCGKKISIKTDENVLELPSKTLPSYSSSKTIAQISKPKITSKTTPSDNTSIRVDTKTRMSEAIRQSISKSKNSTEVESIDTEHNDISFDIDSKTKTEMPKSSEILETKEDKNLKKDTEKSSEKRKMDCDASDDENKLVKKKALSSLS